MFIIAEIGQAHNGSLGQVHAYIDAVSKTGCNAIKFQTHIAEAESSVYEPFRVQFSTQDKTRFDYWKRMEFSLDQWKEIKQHCDEVGLEFMSSPFSNAAVAILEEVGIQRYKIGSGEVTNKLLLQKISETGKPVILSSGMSSFSELDAGIQFLKEKNIEVSLVQCTTAYPTQPEQYGLNVIQKLKDRYHVPVGFSDHSGRIETCIAATTLGAELLEFHVVFDKAMFGPDVSSSLTFSEVEQLVNAVKNIQKALYHPINKDKIEQFQEVKQIFEKSLAVNKNLSKGHILKFEDLEAKKPKGYGVDASLFETVIGKKLTEDLKKWDFLKDDVINL
ncbi:N-acetylneuraminate synthase [Lutibacter oricola]|uniref:N-acetylneuraminate synthase n=1 Tax=Lutibacter oricola TaxID=762486 RepID=A0A1H2X0D2_9FLAO|nr:N-acetylneuraminate synthase family protein [Lutibacter oricola]SDW86312.1 N-acetylneuraminate synthase [Lutibacter oricola]